MTRYNVYWRAAGYAPESQDKLVQRDVHTGVLTDEHDAATPVMPVLVEELSKRVYTPSDLPPDTIVYIEDHPGKLPPIAQRARRAGYRVEHALHDEGMADHPTEPRVDKAPESPANAKSDPEYSETPRD